MEREGLAGLVVSLQLKLTNYENQGKQMKQLKYVWKYKEIEQICFKILDSVWPCAPVRLIRVAVSQCKQMSQIKKDKSLEDFADFKKVPKEFIHKQ